MVRLSLLGAVDLDSADAPAPGSVLSRPKDVAILAYLALATPRGFQRRDTLLALFWPDADDFRARRALNQALYRLRRSLGDDLLPARGADDVGLDWDRWWCDAVELRAAAATQRYDAVLDLYRGELLGGFHVNASVEFEHWLDAERSAVREAAWTAARQLAAAAAAAGEAPREIAYLRQALAIKPLEESVLQRLLEVLHGAGESHTALDEYERFAARLAADFQLEPSRQSTELAQGIRAELAALPQPAQLHRGGPHAHHAPSRRPRWKPAAAIAAATLILVFGAYVLRTSSSKPRVMSIVIADFVNRTDDEYLAAAISEALQADLEQSRSVRVVAGAHIDGALKRMQLDSTSTLSEELAREVALRDGFHAVLRGEVSAVGSSYVIGAQLITPDSGRVLFSTREVAARLEDVLAATDRVSDRLRSQAGESARSARNHQPLEAVTTHSLEALKLYTAGMRLIRYAETGDGSAAGGLPGRFSPDRRPVALFERAIALDSTFAAAHRALAVQLHWSGAQRTRVAELMTRAYQLRHRLTERERLLTEGTYHSIVTDDPEQAMASFEAMLERDPKDFIALQHLGLLYFQHQDFERAVDLYEREWALRGGVPAILYTSALLGAGRVDRADSILRHYAAADTANGLWLAELIRVRAGLGDFVAVDTLLPRLRAVAAAGLPQKRYEDATLVGRLKVWRGYYREGVALQFDRPQQRPPLWVALRRASVDVALLRDTAGVRRRLDSALATVSLDTMAEPPTAFLANVYASLGDHERAQAFADAHKPPYRFSFGSSNDLGLYEVRAQASAAAGDIQRARIILNTAERGLGCWYSAQSFHGVRAAVEALAGHPDSVIAALERLVGVPACKLTLSWSDVWGPTSQPQGHERLGQLYDERGDVRHAIDHYRRFIELWPDPDPELRPRWNAAKRRLAELSAESVRIRVKQHQVGELPNGNAAKRGRPGG